MATMRRTTKLLIDWAAKRKAWSGDERRRMAQRIRADYGGINTKTGKKHYRAGLKRALKQQLSRGK